MKNGDTIGIEWEIIGTLWIYGDLTMDNGDVSQEYHGYLATKKGECRGDMGYLSNEQMTPGRCHHGHGWEVTELATAMESLW